MLALLQNWKEKAIYATGSLTLYLWRLAGGEKGCDTPRAE